MWDTIFVKVGLKAWRNYAILHVETLYDVSDDVKIRR